MIKFFKKILFCIDDRDRKKINLILILVILNTLVELIGISAFIPLMNIIVSPDFYDSNEYLTYILNLLSLSLENTNMILFILIIIFFSFRFFFQITYFFLIQKFLHKVSINLTRNLLDIFYRQPIQITNQSTPSKMFKDIYSEMAVLKSNVFLMIRFVSDVILSTSIIILMLFFNFEITFFSFLFLSIFFILYFFFASNFIKKLGAKRYNHNQKLISNLTQSLNSIREIKLFKLNNFFLKNITLHKDSDGWSKVKHLFLRQLPVFFVEYLLVVIFSLTIIYFLSKNLDTTELIVALGFYAICIFRLIPVINKLSESYQSYQFNIIPIDEIFNALNKVKDIKLEQIEDEHKSDNKISFNSKLEFKKIKFFYENNKSFILEIDNLSIKKNEFIGIYGNSGEGKSTFVDMVSGLISPQQGSISSDNIDINRNIMAWRKKIGYVSQNIYLFDDNLKINICLDTREDSSKIDNNHFEKTLKDSQLIELYSTFKQNTIGENGSKISGGQKQRIAIARALYNKAEILILDEPTSSLDNKMEEKIISFLKSLKNKITIILISHKKENLKIADRLFEIKKGKINEIEY